MLPTAEKALKAVYMDDFLVLPDTLADCQATMRGLAENTKARLSRMHRCELNFRYRWRQIQLTSSNRGAAGPCWQEFAVECTSEHSR